MASVQRTRSKNSFFSFSREGKTETSSPRRAGTASVGGDQVNAHPVAAKEAAVAPISMPVEKTTVPRGATTDGGALADLARMLPDDARAAWSAQPAIPVRLLDSHVNLMVLGESGLGKTTFIRNLVASFSATTKPHDGTSTSLADFMANPQKLTTRLAPMDIVKAGRRLHLSVQDAPGWGDEVHTSRYLRTMMAHLLEARQRDYELLAGSRGLSEGAMCGALRHSVTAVVYFLSPHRVKYADIIIMCALSKLVTLIPVIAKADTMTAVELAAYRKEVRALLAAPGKAAPARANAGALEFRNFDLDGSMFADLGLKADALPLALVTSCEQEAINPKLAAELGLAGSNMSQPVRKYRWGAAYPLNREHSDLLALKRLLLGDRVNSLYAMLDASYHAYVAFAAQFEAHKNEMSSLVQTTADQYIAYLENEEYAAAKSALEAARQAISTLATDNKTLKERIAALEKARA